MVWPGRLIEATCLELPSEGVKALQLLLSDQYWIINLLISGLENQVEAQTQQI